MTRGKRYWSRGGWVEQGVLLWNVVLTVWRIRQDRIGGRSYGCGDRVSE